MFTFTTRITKTKIVVAVFILLIPICIFASAQASNNGNKIKEMSVVKTTADRISFLAKFGWEIEADSEEAKDTLIPAAFDDVYTPYNNLQKAQGLDLTPYKGKKVKLYNYRVVNYPENSQYVYATLLVFENKIIGGDIHSTALDGFMHGFNLSGTGLSIGQPAGSTKTS